MQVTKSLREFESNESSLFELLLTIWLKDDPILQLDAQLISIIVIHCLWRCCCY